jgi:DNA repair protein RadA/Sms
MAKTRTVYTCTECGGAAPKWQGQCPQCGAWNTLVETIAATAALRFETVAGTRSMVTSLSAVKAQENTRIPTGLEEFDRVLGGGLVPGGVVLIGGDPGIGKSTLLLQAMAALGAAHRTLYITGEESVEQVALRAHRLGLVNAPVELLAEVQLEAIVGAIGMTTPEVVVIDSIQTVYTEALQSAPGSVAQVRESAALFTKIAKERSIPIFLIGHVTKEGTIAGPKVIEHMVDTVLQIEGDLHYAFRILRAIKNRFGSTNEIGVFEMRDTGLTEVANPSEVFLSERSFCTSGSTVVASIEGTRPILIEVQALVTSTSYNVPQRNTTGFDYRRLGLLIAVLEKRMGIMLGRHDVFVNIAGGIRIEEPAVDLGIAISIISSLRDVPVDSQTVAIGEVGLGGEVRTVSQIEKRIQEAAKLGFRRIIIPKNNHKGLPVTPGTEIVGVERIEEAVRLLLQ